jgi:hypothetical protein
MFQRFLPPCGPVQEPCKGGAEALTDVLGGRIDFYFCPISTALPLIRDGRVLALVVSTPTRASDLPDVPTSIEAGYPDSDTTVWYGEDAACHRRKIPCRRHEAAGDAADAGKAQATRGRSDAALARGNRQAYCRRDRIQRQADQGRGYSMKTLVMPRKNEGARRLGRV